MTKNVRKALREKYKLYDMYKNTKSKEAKEDYEVILKRCKITRINIAKTDNVRKITQKVKGKNIWEKK